MVRRGLEFGELGCLRVLSACGNVDSESFAAPGDGNGSIRFQEAGDSFAKLSHADFNCGHGHSPYTQLSVQLCVHNCRRGCGRITHGYGAVRAGDERRETTLKTGTRRTAAFDEKKTEEAASNSMESWTTSPGRTRKRFPVPGSGGM